MEDRLTRGFISGAVSGLVVTLLNMVSGSIGLNTLRWVDWMCIVMYDHVPPYSFGETIFSFFGLIVFNGALGVVFAYLIPLISNKNLPFKGWFFGVSAWFLLDGLTTLFHIEGTTPLPLISSISSYASASLYGLFLAQLLTKFEYAGATSRLMPQAAMKPLDNNSDQDKQESESDEVK